MQRLCGFVLIIILLHFLQGCDSPKARPVKLEGIERTIKLDSGLGSFTIVLPKEMDTFFKWPHYNDFKPGDLRKYRYQDSRLPILRKNAIFWDEPDSGSYFTISHNLHLYFNKSDWAGRHQDSLYPMFRRNEKELYFNWSWQLDQDTTINNMRYYISGRTINKEDNRHFYVLNAYTIANDELIKLQFYHVTKLPYSTNFVQDAYERIKHIKYTPER